jgi:hypothetical protein
MTQRLGDDHLYLEEDGLARESFESLSIPVQAFDVRVNCSLSRNCRLTSRRDVFNVSPGTPACIDES